MVANADTFFRGIVCAIDLIPERRFVDALAYSIDRDALNVGQLKTYAVDGTVSPATMAAKGLIEPSAKVKLLANGELGQKLEVHAHRVSAAARQKVESAGGSVVLIDAGTS